MTAGARSPRTVPVSNRRAFWLKHLTRWHWISSAVSLVAMLLFSLTGVTLNHAALIEAAPRVTTKEGRLPAALLPQVTVAEPTDAPAAKDTRPVPDAVAAWIASTLDVPVAGREAEWSEGELYVSLPRPGGDAWLSVDRETGDVKYERTDRGWISYLNDLHKGRNTGEAWRWFIDFFALACIVFCLTGLVLLQVHAGNRPTTWPLVALGLVLPLLLAMLFIHS